MGAYTLLQDLTVATNSTSVVLDDFGTITKDDFVKVLVTHVNPNNSTFVGVRILGNSTVSSNYHRQFLTGNGSSVAAGRDNFARTISTSVSSTSASISYLKLSENDRLNIFTNFNETISNNLTTTFNYTTSSGATFTSGITSLTFEAEQTNGLGTGSRIQIYRLAAEKVRDIIVETNSTQVDIPTTGTFDPAIDKDSEYLLVSDVNQVQSGDILINPNDLNTNGNYYVQAIKGVGSTASAARINQPRFIDGGNGLKHLNYTHIKLSNIGAYTVQSYGIKHYGTSSLEIFNGFISSTAENITSLTKLNVRATTSGAIGTGSRFTLYKLYE